MSLTNTLPVEPTASTIGASGEWWNTAMLTVVGLIDQGREPEITSKPKATFVPFTETECAKLVPLVLVRPAAAT